MTNIRRQAREYREFGAYDRFRSRQAPGRHYVTPRYSGAGRRLVPLMAYQLRRMFAAAAEFIPGNVSMEGNRDDGRSARVADRC
jgi:hypothetical protein